MTNVNDERILKLKEQIAIKREKLGRIGRPSYITNSIIHLDKEAINLNVINNKEQLIALLVRVNALLMSAKDLGVENTYEISGYLATDWIADIKTRLEVLSKKDEERALKQMEAKLESMLSEQKKVELELDEIANLLGDA
jgi:hypothetical protein